jgi:hypothetical protein
MSSKLKPSRSVGLFLSLAVSPLFCQHSDPPSPPADCRESLSTVASQSSNSDPSTRVQLIALVTREGKQLSAVKEIPSGRILILEERGKLGEYQLKQVDWENSSIVIITDGHEHVLRMCNPEEPIDREEEPASIRAISAVLTDWQKHLTSLPLEERDAARQQIRERLREAWERGLDVILKLKPEEQVRLRTQMSRFWRE